jgi:hypothetical protein
MSICDNRGPGRRESLTPSSVQADSMNYEIRSVGGLDH